MPKVLVVDDDQSVFEFVRDVAETVKWTAEWASDGSAALSKLSAMAPQLLLVDLQMPGMGGAEFLRRLQDQASHPQLPVVLISGTYTRDISEEMRTLGVTAVLPKPVPVDELQTLLLAVGDLS